MQLVDKDGYIYGPGVSVVGPNGKPKTTGSGTPIGPAGGDLTGTYPNPSVAWVNGEIVYDTRYYPLASNPAGYLTPSALTPYLTTALAASTYFPIPTGTISQYLRGDGSVASFPSIPTVTPSALTKIDDTNVTLTLGGTPATSLLQAVSLTLGWTGTLADSRIASASTWNAKQPAGNYITALTGEATASGPGSAAITLSTPAVTGKLLTGVNITGGTVQATDSILTGFGKLQNQINGLIGGVIYKGVWDASTNTPALSSSVGTEGWYYIVNVAGNTNLNGNTDWKVGDWAIFNGTVWNKVDNTDAVTSVNGFTGAVSLTTTNISEGTNLYYTESRVNANTNVAANTAARHNAVTLGTSNGLSLSTQQLSLGLASSLATGALSSTDWNTFNSKQDSATAITTSNIGSQSVAYAANSGLLDGNDSTYFYPASNPNGYTNNLGTVTSVGVSVPTGFSVSNTPVTVNGTIGIAFASGYSLPTDASQSNWNQAYNDKINSVSVTGTTVKLLTLTQQDGGTLTTSWTDDNTDAVSSVFGRTGAVVAVSGDYNTSQVTENTNLYYTEARVNANVNVAANTAARHNAVTIGSANGLSLVNQQLSLQLASGSTTGSLSSTDWTTFNNKQNALTNPITGTGTTNYLSKFTGTSELGNSLIFDNGTNVGIGTATPSSKLHLQGTQTKLTITDTTYGRTSEIGYLNNADLYFANDSNSNTYIGRYNNVFLAYGGGKVGIGTTSLGENKVYIYSNLSNTTNTTSALYSVFAPTFTGVSSYKHAIRGDLNIANQGTIGGYGSAGVLGRIQFTGTNTYSYSTGHEWSGVKSEVFMQANNTANRLAGVYISGQTSGGTIGNFYRLLIQDVNVGTVTNDYGIYQVSGVKNYFAGNVGVGTDNPSSLVHLFKSTYPVLTIGSTSITGNIGIDTSANFLNLGTTTNHSLVLATNNTEKLRILPGGNVGIGTTSPGALLQLGNLSSASELLRLSSLYANDRTAKGGITWRDNTDITGRIYTEYDGTMVSMVFGSLYNSAYNTNNLMIIRGNGNVGIGTSSPQGKLSVDGGDFRFNYANAATGYYLYLNHNSGQDGGVLLTRDNSTMDWQINNDASTGDLQYYSYGISSLAVTFKKSNGYVGIGTSSPSQKLDIQGNVSMTGTTIYKSGSTSIMLAGRDEDFYGGTNSDGGIFVYGNNKLHLSTNSGRRLTIDGSGNVGIGTTFPTEILDVSTTRSYGQSANIGISLGGTDNGYVDNGATSSWRQYVSGDSNGQALKFDGFVRGTGWTERMRIASSGNVGIGTTDPNKQLTFAQAADDAIQIRRLTTSQGNPSIGTGISWTWADSTSDNQTWAAIRVIMPGSGNTNMTFSTSYGSGASGMSERMRISDTGNIGIGTTAPTARLHVAAPGALATNIALRVRNSADTGDLLSVAGNGSTVVSSLTATSGIAISQPAGLYYPSISFSNNGGAGQGSITGYNGKLLTTNILVQATYSLGVGFAPFDSIYAQSQVLAKSALSTDNAFAVVNNPKTGYHLKVNNAGNVQVGVGGLSICRTDNPGGTLLGTITYRTDGSFGMNLPLTTTKIISPTSSLSFTQLDGFQHIQQVTGSWADAPNAFIFQSTGAQGLNSANNNFVSVINGGSSLFVIKAQGNVGIGTTSPSQKLHVNGNVYIENDLIVNGSITATTPTANNYICQIGLSVDQNLSSGADALLDFIDMDDPNDWYDPSAKTFSPTVAGYYHIDFSVWFDSSPVSTAQYNIQVRKNGSTIMIAQQPTINNGTGQSLTSSKIIYFNGSSDFIDFTAYQNTGSTRKLLQGTDSSGTYASIFLLAM